MCQHVFGISCECKDGWKKRFENLAHWEISKNSSSISCKSKSTCAKTFLKTSAFGVVGDRETWGLSGTAKLAAAAPPKRWKARPCNSSKLGWLEIGSPRTALFKGQTACWFELMIWYLGKENGRFAMLRLLIWWMKKILWTKNVVRNTTLTIIRHPSSAMHPKWRQDL